MLSMQWFKVSAPLSTATMIETRGRFILIDECKTIVVRDTRKDKVMEVLLRVLYYEYLLILMLGVVSISDVFELVLVNKGLQNMTFND